MSDQDQDQDKTEKATPFKLQEAKRKGQVGKSTDLTSVFILIAFTVVFLMTAAGIGEALRDGFRAVIPMSPDLSLTLQNAGALVQAVIEPVLLSISPILLALAVMAILGSVLQTGFVFSSHPIKPDFTRLNPAKGFKKFFNLRILFELGKVIVKMGLIAGTLWAGFAFMTPRLVHMTVMEPTRIPSEMMRLGAITAFVLIVIFVVTSLLDLAFNKYDFAKQMRMSRRELKDEHKRREGDPEVKSKRKQNQQELRKRAGSASKTKDSDLVLVNPTHVSVALQYRPGKMLAPQVLAMGAGGMAGRIREIARRHGIPVVRRPALARRLFRASSLDRPVPEEFYEDLAPLFRWLMEQPQSRVKMT